MIVLVDLSCLGAWVVSHDHVVMFLVTFAVISTLVIFAPDGWTRFRIRFGHLGAGMERKS